MIEQHYSHVLPKIFGNQLLGIEMDEIKQDKDRIVLSLKEPLRLTLRELKNGKLIINFGGAYNGQPFPTTS
ncbi:hypothetical protein ALTBGP9_03136 [Alteromonas macleodii]|jgi:hypothetical protein|uniref:hypothetical protein n=1 Tax=Alteromonas sp. KUL150 TaxID=2480805 RepID=UPI001282AD74|nr:hypothetical protein [Alteromonas sp. KUL150]CAI2391231.1 hypothetical protein ALT831_03219 [Alteromonas macleodii]CAI3965583.1 hypothetical protein ALTBGP9_03136 [Alteromonas macleodii]CAI3965963.1 hypothetical protein ALTBGP6_03220 [Alteromonas macleodii]CAI3965967.1 hypothetical protein ALTBGP14_03219 [Alteromonas macleodii]VTO40828.1 hypothetical protein ALTBGP6_03220 [Alteromonas macleodii]